jgi:hypothetical protein
VNARIDRQALDRWYSATSAETVLPLALTAAASLRRARTSASSSMSARLA